MKSPNKYTTIYLSKYIYKCISDIMESESMRKFPFKMPEYSFCCFAFYCQNKIKKKCLYKLCFNW